MSDGLKLGAPEGCIAEAAKSLGVVWPEELVTAWTIFNGLLEIEDDWIVFPVFDPERAGKTAGHVVEENTRGRWEMMPKELIAIGGEAGGGDVLVLKNEGAGRLGNQVFVWLHETGGLEPWEGGLGLMVQIAQSRVAFIEKQMKRRK